MSRPMFRSRRAWPFLIIGLVATLSVILVADRYLGNRAPGVIRHGGGEVAALSRP